MRIQITWEFYFKVGFWLNSPGARASILYFLQTLSDTDTGPQTILRVARVKNSRRSLKCF